jgi:hypothetical protein
MLLHLQEFALRVPFPFFFLFFFCLNFIIGAFALGVLVAFLGEGILFAFPGWSFSLLDRIYSVPKTWKEESFVVIIWGRELPWQMFDQFSDYLL